MLARLLEFCESKLGIDAKKDLRWYDSRRPKRVSARSFYESYARALLVSGIGAEQADTWAGRSGFWEVFTLENCRRYQARVLLRRVNVVPDNKMGRKLTVLHGLGRALAGLTPRQVADRYFGGIIRSRDLSEDNVPTLDDLSLIGPPSARFIIRNMGGELIKDDRWLNELVRYFRCDLSEFERAGKEIGWMVGRVDLVLWWYCKQEIGSTSKLAAHFRGHGFAPNA
jgi:hypothetical protein